MGKAAKLGIRKERGKQARTTGEMGGEGEKAVEKKEGKRGRKWTERMEGERRNKKKGKFISWVINTEAV